MTVIGDISQMSPPQSDNRFQSLTELLFDWYWEQDENYRFTVLAGLNPQSSQINTKHILGTARWDHRRTPFGDGTTWDKHKAVLEARQPFTEFVYKSVRANEELQYTSVSGWPIFDKSGKFCGYCGVSKDVTQQIQLGMRRAIEHAVTRILATSNSINEATPKIIREICTTLGWACGAYWELNAQDDTLRCAESWGTASPEVKEFLGSLNVRVGRQKGGRGLIRSAWETGEPLWILDVTKEASFGRAAEAEKAGLHSAFAFPIKIGVQVIGAMEFFSQEIHRPDTPLLACVAYVGDQISQLSQLMRAREQLRESEERFRSLIELSSDWLWEQDDQFRFTFLNGGVLIKEDEEKSEHGLIGKTRWDFPTLNLTEEDWARHRAQLERHESFYDFEMRRPDFEGKERWSSVSGRPIFDSQGKFKGYRGVGRDITARKANEERIQYLATHDGLTNLPNRTLFAEILNRTIQSSLRYNRKFAVLFIDLDRFKLINDTLGHEAGDMLLKLISDRLTQCLRTSDVIARLGGDEFVVLVHEVNDPKYVVTVADKILSSIVQPIMLLDQECRVTASIGICMYPANGQDEQSMMKNADVAMYRAKEEGKNNYQFFSEEINTQSLERLALETSLRHALERQQFFLHYQAKLDLKTRQITGVEALLRWQHPELGVVPPLQFIPLAEETGLIAQIGQWVLNTACAQNAAWQREGIPPICMAVNLSARQFTDEFLLDHIAAALGQSGMDPQLLELELTESMVIQNPDRAIKLLLAIKKLGVRLAIDDFGTGYSSLGQLKRFPIDTLKVDRSFIRDIPRNAEDKAITKAIIAMGKTLSLTVVAEGVETEEQEAFLRDEACDEIQGFFFSKPIAPDEFAQLFLEHRKNK